MKTQINFATESYNLSLSTIYIVAFALKCWLTLERENFHLKFTYFEKAIKFGEISSVDLTVTMYKGQIQDGDFSNLLTKPQL